MIATMQATCFVVLTVFKFIVRVGDVLGYMPNTGNWELIYGISDDIPSVLGLDEREAHFRFATTFRSRRSISFARCGWYFPL